MIEIWGNKFEPANPYGPADPERLAEFQQVNDFSLPADYLQYLMTANGGVPGHTYFLTDRPRNQYADYELSKLYAFGGGDSPLEVSWRLSEYYDLDAYAEELKSYIVIGDLSFGDLLLVHVTTGQVCVFDHEEIDDLPRGAISVVATGFSAFICGLMSEQELLSKTHSQEELAEFERRLEEAKKRRAERARGYPDMRDV